MKKKNILTCSLLVCIISLFLPLNTMAQSLPTFEMTGLEFMHLLPKQCGIFEKVGGTKKGFIRYMTDLTKGKPEVLFEIEVDEKTDRIQRISAMFSVHENFREVSFERSLSLVILSRALKDKKEREDLLKIIPALIKSVTKNDSTKSNPQVEKEIVFKNKAKLKFMSLYFGIDNAVMYFLTITAI